MFGRRLLMILPVVALAVAGCSSARQAASPPAAAPTSADSSAATAASPSPSVSSSDVLPTPSQLDVAAPHALPSSAVSTTSAAAPATTGLPLAYSTGSATQLITVVAKSTGSTTAVLQRWAKSSTGWSAVGSAITAHLGSAGLTSHPSESVAATPIGSFSLTQAFGALSNPGSGLPYRQTNPNDWWISQSGALYNTFQECASNCAFTQGDPNEHLYYETPYYNYAVVIDVNVNPVVQGAGSAFFLHVTDGGPTAGCVSIPQTDLVTIMQWLSPAAAPRMLIGVG